MAKVGSFGRSHKMPILVIPLYLGTDAGDN